MVKFPATRRVLFHHLFNVLLIEFKLSAGLAKHLAASLAPGRGRGYSRPSSLERDSGSLQILEHAIETGRGGVYLCLTPEQYAKLRRP
jgi:hypothetical protein